MNSKIKRFSAMSMAILSLGSGMGSVINNNLDLAPKASAVSFSKPAIKTIFRSLKRHCKIRNSKKKLTL